MTCFVALPVIRVVGTFSPGETCYLVGAAYYSRDPSGGKKASAMSWKLARVSKHPSPCANRADSIRENEESEVVKTKKEIKIQALHCI
jgi:hypothetical protein